MNTNVESYFEYIIYRTMSKRKFILNKKNKYKLISYASVSLYDDLSGEWYRVLLICFCGLCRCLANDIVSNFVLVFSLMHLPLVWMAYCIMSFFYFQEFPNDFIWWFSMLLICLHVMKYILWSTRSLWWKIVLLDHFLTKAQGSFT